MQSSYSRSVRTTSIPCTASPRAGAAGSLGRRRSRSLRAWVLALGIAASGGCAGSRVAERPSHDAVYRRIQRQEARLARAQVALEPRAPAPDTGAALPATDPGAALTELCDASTTICALADEVPGEGDAAARCLLAWEACRRGRSRAGLYGADGSAPEQAVAASGASR